MDYRILIGVFFITLVVIVLYLIFRKKNYSRERFAFFSTLLIFSFGSTVFTHIVFDYSLINIISILFNELPLDNIEIQSTSWSDKIWSVIILFMLIAFVISIFDKWRDDGSLSSEDQKLLAVNKDLSFYHAALYGMKLGAIPLASPDDSVVEKEKYELYHLDRTLDWHSEVRDLLNMSSQQYKILDTDWHSEKKTFISSYSNQSILVLCTQSLPSKNTVSETINYFVSNYKIDRVIVAAKELSELPVNNECLGHRVEYKSKSSMLDNLVNFEDYYEYIREAFNVNEVSEGDGVCLKDIYVSSSGYLADLDNKSEGKDVSNVESFLINWATDNKNNNQVTLLGEYGQGKSVLSMKLALELIESKANRIPIIIELRGKSPRNETMASIIASWALRFNINVKAVQKLLQEGRLVVILEGFDELDLVGDKLRRLEHFKRLWEFARYKKSKVMITGRPNLFLNNNEAREYLHLNNDSSSLFQVTALHLKPFSRDKIDLALRKSSSDIKSQILRLYDSGNMEAGFNDLISRPSTLYQTSVIWNELDKSNLNSAKVINEFINHAYRRQAEKLQTMGPTGLEPSVLTIQERSYFMLGVAVGMVKKTDYSNQISGSLLEAIVSRLYWDIPAEVSSDHPSAMPLRERLELHSDGIDSIYSDVRTSGILVRELAVMDSFKFAHKSFLEFLFSKYIVGLIIKDDSEIVYNTISSSLSVVGDTFKFSFSEEVVGHIVEGLLDETDEFDEKSALKLINKINPKLKRLDDLFFRQYFGVTFFGWSFGLLSAISVYGIHSAGIPQEAKMVGTWIFLLPLMFISSIRYSIIKDEISSYDIWCSACSKFDFNYRSSSIFSKKIVEYFTVEYAGLDKYVLKLQNLYFETAFKIAKKYLGYFDDRSG